MDSDRVNEVFQKDTRKYVAKNRRMAQDLTGPGKGSPFVSVSEEEWKKIQEERPDVNNYCPTL